jgi:hypothetical protein
MKMKMEDQSDPIGVLAFSFLFGPGHMEPASSPQLGHCFQVLSWPSVVLLAARGTCYVTG